MTEYAALDDGGRQPGDLPHGAMPFREATDPLSMPRPQRDIWIRKQILATIEKRSPAVQIANLRRILALKRRGPI